VYFKRSMNEIKPDLEGLGEPTALAKVTNDALKFCDSDLVPLVHPIVEYRYHTGVGISEGADFRVEVRFICPARVV